MSVTTKFLIMVLVISMVYHERSMQIDILSARNIKQKQLINDLSRDYEQKVSELENKVASLSALNLRISAYTKSKDETNDDPENTAIMEKPIPGKTCAVSRDLKHLLGKEVYITGVGVRRVNDLMNSRYENSMDLLVGSKDYAMNFGVQEKEIVVIN